MDIAAILLSPVIAVLVTLWYQSRKEKRDLKRWVFNTLMATRHSPITDETVRALNMIDVVFHKAPRIRQLWHHYFDMLTNEGLNNSQGWSQRSKKNLEMITAIAADLGYGRSITHLDVDRVYYPVGLGRQAERANEISTELLRVLRNSQGIVVAPREQQASLPPGHDSISR